MRILFFLFISFYCGAQIAATSVTKVPTPTPSGQSYLASNAYFFYDFTKAQTNGTFFDVVKDGSPNGRTIIANNSPISKTLQVGDKLVRSFKAVNSPSNNVFTSAFTGTGIFDRDFEVVWTMNYDGPLAQTTHVLGVNHNTNKFFISINNNQWNIQYQYNGSPAKTYAAISAANYFSTVPNGNLVCRLKFDFTNDINTLEVNGVDVPLTLVGGFDAFSSLDPTKWANAVQNVAIGGYNNAGTIATNLSTCNYMQIAATPIMTQAQWNSVVEYFNQEVFGETLKANKRIVTFSNLLTNPIRKTTANTTQSFGIALSVQPTANVTVSFASLLSKFTASSSLTFTTSNWATPQAVTLTGVNDGVTDIALTDKLTISCSGGGYDNISKEMDVSVYDNTSFPYLTLYGTTTWTNDIHVTAANASTVRANAVSFIFNGSGIPVDAATVQTSNYTGQMHTYTNADFTGYTSIDKLTCTYTDVNAFVWTYKMYHLKRASPIGLAIVHQGHETDKGQHHELIVNALLAANYDVLFCAMPLHGDNTTTNGSTSFGSHSTIKTALDASTYSPLCLYLAHIAKGINYCTGARSYGGNIIMTGISGGGWTTIVYAGIDSRITKSFPMRGHMIRQFDAIAGDYEQADFLATCGQNIFDYFGNTCSYSDLMILAGSNGLTEQLGNTNDIVVAHYSNRFWLPKLQRLNPLSGSILSFISTNSSYSAHAYDSESVAEIISKL